MITEQKSYNIPEQVKLMDYIEKNKKNYNLILRLMEISSDKKFIKKSNRNNPEIQSKFPSIKLFKDVFSR